MRQRGALAFIADLRVNIGGWVEIQAKPKVKASTVIHAMNAVERASRWRPLVVFFDEFQEIAENLDEKQARHLLSVLRGEIQRQTHVAYIFAAARAAQCSICSLPRAAISTELLLDETTPAQRRALLAIAVREDEEFARDRFLRFAGFRQHSSLSSAMRPFLKGNLADALR